MPSYNACSRDAHFKTRVLVTLVPMTLVPMTLALVSLVPMSHFIILVLMTLTRPFAVLFRFSSIRLVIDNLIQMTSADNPTKFELCI